MISFYNQCKAACLLFLLGGVIVNANALDKPTSAIPLAPNTIHQDFLTQPAETKWYTMTNSGAGKLTVLLDMGASQNVNYDLRLYRLNAANNTLVEEVVSGLPTGFNEQVSKITASGNTWYVAVNSVSGIDSANPFGLKWIINGSNDPREPNDSPQQASVYPYIVETPNPIDGNHDNGSDVDWYKYTVPVGGLFKGFIAHTFDANGVKLPFADTTGQIYDSNFNLIKTLPPYKIINDIPFTPGVYYFKLYSPSKAGGTAYSLRFTAKAPLIISRVAISNVTTEGGVYGFINYGQGNKWRVKGNIGISGIAYNAGNTPIANAEVRVSVQPKLDSTPTTATVLTGSDGSFLLNLALPPAAGQFVYDNVVSLHYYDIIPVRFTSAGNSLSANIADFYHFAYQILP